MSDNVFIEGISAEADIYIDGINDEVNVCINDMSERAFVYHFMLTTHNDCPGSVEGKVREARRIYKEITEQLSIATEVKGPPVSECKDEDGTWNKIAEGFAAKAGITIDQIEIREINGIEYIYKK